MLVVSYEDNRVLPVRPVAHRSYQVGDIKFASANIRWGMLVGSGCGEGEGGIDERNGGQSARCRVSQKSGSRSKMRTRRAAKHRRSREIAKIIGPSNVVAIEQIEDRPA